MGSACFNYACKVYPPINKEIFLEEDIDTISKDDENFRVLGFLSIYYFKSSPEKKLNAGLSTSNFNERVNKITSLSYFEKKKFDYIGLLIICQGKLIYAAHKLDNFIKFYKVSDKLEGVNKMNIFSFEKYPNQIVYENFINVKENIKIKDIRNYIKQNKKIKNTFFYFTFYFPK